jgi:hypothetical protein
MALHGKVIELGKDRLGFEHVSFHHEKPMQIRQVWPIATYRTRGMSYCSIADAIGRAATISDGRVSCYLGNGNYLEGALPQLGQTQSIVCEESAVPAPKVRRGTETRWHNSQWQKLTRKGWSPI